MDLGLAGKWALVGGASKGLGWGCARALAHEGVNVVMVARGAQVLSATVAKLQAEVGPGVKLIAVAQDITTVAGRDAVFTVAGGPGKNFDIVVTNAGGPPPGDFRDWDRDAWIKAIDANMLTPIDLIKATVDGMAARGFGRIVNITSSSVKSPIDVLGLSNGARSGLTGFVAGTSRSRIASQGVTINNLLPGRFDTDRIRATLPAMAEKAGKSIEEMRALQQAQIPAGRYGTAEEFGSICAFLCSQQAAYLTGQNVLADGGAYPGTY
jgi:3-oxoacyl-[acyl-carrier protein] reductase